VKLEGEAVAAWSEPLIRLVRIARAGSLYPDPLRLLQLIEVCARPAPKQAVASVVLDATSGLPSKGVLEKLTALRDVAVRYLAEHGARPTRASSGWSASLAAADLPFVSNTSARLVAKGRYLVVHDRWGDGRFTFHLADPKGRFVAVDRAEQAQVKAPLRLALEVACREGAEHAFLQLSALLEVSEAVKGQLAPFVLEGPLAGTLHLVLERAATDVAADANRDPFGAIDASVEAQQRRAAGNFHVSRERRLCCLPESLPLVEAHLKSLGALIVVRSK